MCGILCIHSFNEERLNTTLLERANKTLNRLSHRGPYGSGIFHKNSSILGHVRLSIIDVDNGQQPMISEDGNFGITYNGEVYNYLEIRNELIDKGHIFKTNSDTEVVLKSFIEFGIDCVNKFEGMFAFVIVNFKTKELFAARDRFGIKPLYFSKIDETYFFSSEIKPLVELDILHNDFNTNKLEEFLVFGYIAGEKTIYNDISHIEAGHLLHLTCDKFDYKRYWAPGKKILNISFHDALKELNLKIRNAVESWSISDVEIGTLLSGGVDSSLVTAIANQRSNSLKTFSLVFPNDKDIDESAHIKNFLKFNKVNNNLINFDEKYFIDNLFKLSNHLDEPIMDPNVYTLMAICDKIKKNSNLKVILCGEGADELFGGYARHRQIAEEYSKFSDDSILLLALNRVAIPRLEILGANKKFSKLNRYKIIKSLVSSDHINKVLEYDQLTFLNTRLHSLDRIGMMHGLEIRTPFLDHRLAEFVNSLLGEYKINDDWSKFILRKVAENYIPSKIAWERKKTGLSIPYSRILFKGELKNFFLDMVINNGKITKYFCSKNILSLLKLHNPKNGEDHSNTLFRILSLELFLRSI